MFDDVKKELDQPLDIKYKLEFLKANKIRVIIINEDLSGKEFFIKFPESYVIEVKGRYYFVVPKAIIRIGKFPTIVYYYNNPFPIEFVFTKSEVTALDLRSEKEREALSEEERVTLSGILIDSKMVKLGFDSRVMGNIYGRKPMTVRTWLMIGGAIVLVIIIFLQLFGYIDVFSMFTGQK